MLRVRALPPPLVPDKVLLTGRRRRGGGDDNDDDNEEGYESYEAEDESGGCHTSAALTSCFHLLQRDCSEDDGQNRTNPVDPDDAEDHGGDRETIGRLRWHYHVTSV